MFIHFILIVFPKEKFGSYPQENNSLTLCPKGNVTRKDKVVQSIISTKDWPVGSSMFNNVISILVSYQYVLNFSPFFLNQLSIT